MALRLGITPTYYFSCKFRVLHSRPLHRLSSSSFALGFVLLPYPLSKRLQLPSTSPLPRFAFFRHQILASSFSQEPEEEGQEAVVPKKNTVSYDLSSGFLQTRRQGDSFGQRNLSQVGQVGDEDGEKPQHPGEKLASEPSKAPKFLGTRRSEEEGYDESRKGNTYEASGREYNDRTRKWIVANNGNVDNSEYRSRTFRGGTSSTSEQEFEEESTEWGDDKREWLGSNARNSDVRSRELRVSANDKLKYGSSRGIRSRFAQQGGKELNWWGEGEGGDWQGSLDESPNFKNSKLYEDPKAARNEAKQSYGARSAGPRPILPPSNPSIPGKFSKYSRPAHQGTNVSSRKLADAFPTRSSSKSASAVSTSPLVDPESKDKSANNTDDAEPTIFIPAVIMPEYPYQFSYTETPKVAPIGFREPVYSPFGPETMSRPWTGRAPLAKSKKKLPEFDSFKPPPPGKKGVKHVQPPGPYPEGEGPKLGQTREEILGAPLSKAEVKELVERSQKESRQLNLGRDGLTHNMLDLVHQHWKRRRVCRIKCKGVPTIDMDNVCRVLEEKSGGKIIHRAGGAVFLFRGRNYNYKTRPKIPIMLWKPPTPIYPKLIQPAPEGLTREEADKLRLVGRKLPAICRLGKNGVYLTLVQDVRDAFKVDDLVKVDCKGMNPSDYKKIGAKLKDLVPCVLLSFERECILMWKGPESQVEGANTDGKDTAGAETISPYEAVLSEGSQELLHETLLREGGEPLDFDSDESGRDQEDEEDGQEDSSEDDATYESDMDEIHSQGSHELESADDEARYHTDLSPSLPDVASSSESALTAPDESRDLETAAIKAAEAEEAAREFDSLWQQALDSGEAATLEEPDVDPDTLFTKVKAMYGDSSGIPAQPPKKRSKKLEKDRSANVEVRAPEKVPKDPSGLLRVDELAKLLAP